MADKYVFTDWTNVQPGYGTGWLGAKNVCLSPSGISLRVHRPRMEETPVLLPEAPWEQYCLNGYATVMRDGGKIRMWYECFPPKWKPGYDDMDSLLCYAESEDGVHFTRPDLGLWDFRGSKHNNILMSVHGSSVFRDDDAPAEERYKLVFVKYVPGDPDGHVNRIYGGVSPDGIRFTVFDEPILDNFADTENVLRRDPETGEYLLFTRQNYRFRAPRRSISISRSRDFRHFPEPENLFTSDPRDPADWDYYTNAFTPWPGARYAYLMFVDMYHRTEDSFDVHLLTGSDPKIWNRPLGTEPWIGNGEYGRFDDKMVCALNGIVDNLDGTWSTYVSCTRRGHNDSDEEYPAVYGEYHRTVLREDGFMSLRADAKGEFYTVVLPVKGDCVTVNCALPLQGRLRVGIFDPEAEAFVPGFAPEDCSPLKRDTVRQAVAWNGNTDISALKGRNVCLYFEMFKADLYAFEM